MGKDKRQSPSTLLWFIRHKSYVPISEIRRRFFIESDEGSFIDGDNHHRVYVGLPAGTAQSIEKLWKQGKIGLEFSVEFDARVLIGVYPMNPSKEHLNGSHNGSYRPQQARDLNGNHESLPRGINGDLNPPETETEPLEAPHSVN
jgi:hypothetical protein